MSTREHRRSARIYELNAQRSQQTNSQNKDNETFETAIEFSSTGGRDFNIKRGKRKVKTRSIQDLIMDTAAYQVGNSGYEDHHTNSVGTSTGPEIDASRKSKLELLLSILKRRDSFDIFAEPVNPDEVNGYYDVIKEPMDFGKISTKLNGGSYKTLEEFEHDVFLVSNNAMVFNASTTVYYRQACAIKNLTQKLFLILKTEPENFENEVSKMRLRGGREIKREMEISNFGSCEKSNDCKEDRLRGEQNANNWNLESFLNENKSVVPSIYESPERLITNMETIPNNIRYKDSLAQFSKDIGSYAEIISGKKLRRSTSTEDLNHQFEVPNVASGHNSAVNRGHGHFGAYGGEPIHVAQNHEIHLGISGPNFTRRNNSYNDTSNRGISNSFNNDNVIQKTDMNSSYLKEKLSYQKRKFSEFVRDEARNSYQGGIPTTTWNTGSRDNAFISSSLYKSKNSRMVKESSSNPEQTPTDQREKLMDVMRKGNFCKTLNTSQREKITSSCIKHFHMAEAISSAPKSTQGCINFMEAIREGDNKLFQGEYSTTSNECRNQDKFFSSTINKGKNLYVAETDSKKFPADQLEKYMDVAIEGANKSYQSEFPHVSTTRYTSRNQEKMNFSMNREKHFQMAKAAFSKPKKFLVDPCKEFCKSTNKEGNSSKNDISDQFIQRSNFSPVFTDAGTLYFSGAESKQFIPSAISECKNVPMAAMNSGSKLQNVGEIIGETTESMRVGGHVFQEHMANQRTGNGFFSTHLLVGEDLCIVNPLNVSANFSQFISSMNNSVNVQMPEGNGGNSIPTAMNEGMNVKTVPTLTSSGPMTQGTLSATGHGVPPSVHRQLFSPLITEPNGNQAHLIPSLDVNFPYGLNKLQTVGNGGQPLLVEQTWNWRQSMQLQSQPIMHSSMQMQPRPPLVDLANQTTPSQRQGQSAPVYNQLMNWEPIPILAAAMQMQSMPHKVNLAGQTVPSQWRQQGTDAVNEQVMQLHPPPISASPSQMQQKPNWVYSADQAAHLQR